jgi:hypothetical protein
MKTLARLLVLVLATAGAAAEVIRIPLGAQGSALTAEQLPARGTASSQVLQQLGEPTTRHPPSGEPPIARWDYADFSIYFENDRVLHCVLRHRPVAPAN